MGHHRRRRRRRRRKHKDGMDKMLNKMPNMMMNMMMMKMMGKMANGMGPAGSMMKMMQPQMAGMMGGGKGCASTCNPMGVCNCRPKARCDKKDGDRDRAGNGGRGQCLNHPPMACPTCGMGSRFSMNPGMMHMGMPGMGMMNPMMGGMGMGMGMGMNPMMMMGGMHHPHMMHHGLHHMNNHLMHQMFGGHGGHGLIGSYGFMGRRAGKINPMFNVNMGYMMGRAVKKCQPLKNGLEICAMYNPMTNQLNID